MLHNQHVVSIILALFKKPYFIAIITVTLLIVGMCVALPLVLTAKHPASPQRKLLQSMPCAFIKYTSYVFYIPIL